MNFFYLFFKTSLSVQISISILIGCSILSWSIIFNRILFFKITQYKLKKFENKFWSGIELSRLYQEISMYRNNLHGITRIFYVGFKEFSNLCQMQCCSSETLITRTSHTMYTTMHMELEESEMYIPFIGTIGMISPYVGLFGTVLGIIHVFIELGGINNSTNNHTIYIQTISPGIAEALISTAIGLFVAIPAVIGFNYLNAQNNNLNCHYNNFIEEFINILYRQISCNTNFVLNKDLCHEKPSTKI